MINIQSGYPIFLLAWYEVNIVLLRGDIPQTISLPAPISAELPARQEYPGLMSLAPRRFGRGGTRVLQDMRGLGLVGGGLLYI